MLDSFDPKEKKAILVFIALLLLGVIYLSTHRMSWTLPDRSMKLDQPREELIDIPRESPSSSGRFL